MGLSSPERHLYVNARDRQVGQSYLGRSNRAPHLEHGFGGRFFFATIIFLPFLFGEPNVVRERGRYVCLDV